VRSQLTIVLLGLLACTPAAAQRPPRQEQQRILDTARQIAIEYTGKLPDFICTENVERTDRVTSSNMTVDRLTIQLSYFGQKERYKLLTINGTKTGQSFESLDGLISGGEFGSLLRGVFDPSSAADFQWKRSSELRKMHVAVYTYRVMRAKSHYMLGYRDPVGKLASLAAGYHGEVALDNETARVFRLTAAADDIPSESKILQSSVVVDYDFIKVAGQNYLLPSHSESHMERSYRQVANVVTFAGYRKFETDSKIDFR
jgi:hypothetical protein